MGVEELRLCGQDPNHAQGQVPGPVNASVEGSPDGVNASANHSDLEWDRGRNDCSGHPECARQRTFPTSRFLQIPDPSSICTDQGSFRQRPRNRDGIHQGSPGSTPKAFFRKEETPKEDHQMLRRVTVISSELHTLNSHPGDWIELGISEFARIPDCMMPILDLAGQGVQVFCKTRRVS
ncbi:hypothetical protein AXX17_AT5G31410 [Arabidopsis thaliana]|uniref:Uncharacterized protein n=1 Tax=Arabidopsis thaliana TaxID=3702 RepID=A0A178UQC0_ARATH|nr:hypothetical protein AXX17_AT5G31410 [Arabidopsis thaliana]